jgi:hypothetical protein
VVAFAGSPSVVSMFRLARTLLYIKIMQISLLRSVLFVALAGGCVGSGQFTVASDVAAPDLVVISPGVQVIADLDEPIFYSGNYYWRNQGGFWYRSTSHTRGWARVEVAPVEIRTIERPSAYVHYHGAARAQISGERRGPPPVAVVRDHRESATTVRAPPPRRGERTGTTRTGTTTTTTGTTTTTTGTTRTGTTTTRTGTTRTTGTTTELRDAT